MVFIHARAFTSKHLMLLPVKVAPNACTNIMFVCIICEMTYVQTGLFMCQYLPLKHLAIWTQPQPGAASTVAVKVAGLAAKWWNLQEETSHLRPQSMPQKLPIRNNAPKKKTCCWVDVSKKSRSCVSFYRRDADTGDENFKCLYNKGIKMSTGSGDLCPTPDMHKRWSWTVHRPQKIRGRTFLL